MELFRLNDSYRSASYAVSFHEEVRVFLVQSNLRFWYFADLYNQDLIIDNSVRQISLQHIDFDQEITANSAKLITNGEFGLTEVIDKTDQKSKD